MGDLVRLPVAAPRQAPTPDDYLAILGSLIGQYHDDPDDIAIHIVAVAANLYRVTFGSAAVPVLPVPTGSNYGKIPQNDDPPPTSPEAA